MLDFGLAELVIIMAVAVFVIGPQDIPKIMVSVGRVVRRLRYMRYAFTQQFEELIKDADLEDINKQVNFEARAEEGAEFNEAAEDEEYMDVMEPLEPPKSKGEAS